MRRGKSGKSCMAWGCGLRGYWQYQSTAKSEEIVAVAQEQAHLAHRRYWTFSLFRISQLFWVLSRFLRLPISHYAICSLVSSRYPESLSLSNSMSLTLST